MSGTTTPPDPCELLRQADLAWHALNTGTTVREVQDQNGERVVYSTANRAGLLAYMRQLQTLCTEYQSPSLALTTPTRFLFR